MTLIRHVIGDQEVESLSGERFPDRNPWTRSPWAEVVLGSRADADRAVDAARRAFDQGRGQDSATPSGAACSIASPT
jgi:acyl-CoA reductase-like NAD-dependent aldehyde dehydrogenase